MAWRRAIDKVARLNQWWPGPLRLVVVAVVVVVVVVAVVVRLLEFGREKPCQGFKKPRGPYWVKSYIITEQSLHWQNTKNKEYTNRRNHAEYTVLSILMQRLLSFMTKGYHVKYAANTPTYNTFMMTSRYGNAFRITDPLWGESPLERANTNTEHLCSLCCKTVHTVQ